MRVDFLSHLKSKRFLTFVKGFLKLLTFAVVVYLFMLLPEMVAAGVVFIETLQASASNNPCHFFCGEHAIFERVACDLDGDFHDQHPRQK